MQEDYLNASDADDDRDSAGFVAGSILALAFIAAATVAFFSVDLHLSRHSEMMAEAAANIAELADTSHINPELDGRLVHATGRVRVADGAADPLLGIKTGALSLGRVVRYYQWQREQRRQNSAAERLPGNEIHEKRWVSQPIDSGRLRRGDEGFNTVLARIPPEQFTAAQATLGAYSLSDAVKTAAPGAKELSLDLDNAHLAAIQARILPGPSPRRTLVHATGNELYVGANPRRPAIGDVRIKFYAAEPDEISVLAFADGDTLREFQAANGETLALVRAGNRSAAQMLGAKSLVAGLERWAARVALVIVFWLALFIMSHWQGWKRGGSLFPAVALAAFVVAASGIWRRGFSLSELAPLLVGAAALGLFAAMPAAKTKNGR